MSLRRNSSVVLALATLGGCGSAGHGARSHASTATAVTPCEAAARDAVARFLGTPPARVAITASTGGNSMPQCAFRARAALGGRVEATANLDDGPQPYFRLERTAIEAAQVFTPGRVVPAPEPIAGLGLEADWFPAQSQVMTTDGVRLVTVSVSWPGVPHARERALAEALSRTYLRVPPGKRGASLASGYPSG
jgi:hypothetical protein